MSNPDQDILKVLEVVFHRPPYQIVIPLPPGLILRRVLYLIGCSSRILLSDLPGRQQWRGLGWYSHWDLALGTGQLRRLTRMKGGFGWMSGRWDVTLPIFFIVSFGFSIPVIMTEGQKIKDIYNGLLKV